MPVLNTANKLYVGGVAVDKVYQGTNLVWSSFSPKSLAGLITWLDASQIPGNVITTQWSDLSGGNHHGNIVASPAPTVRTNALNGLPVVRFKLNEGRVRSGQTFNFSGLGAFNFTITYVVRMWGANVGRVYTSEYPAGGNFLVGMHTQGIDCMYAEGWISQGSGWVIPSPWRLYTGTASHDGANYNISFFVDGVQKGQGGGGGGMGNYYNLSGYDATLTQETCDCEVAELVIYNRRLSDAERQQVEAYLKKKWGLP